MKIGNLEFNKPIALAPMEDVTDISFRQICKQMGADIVYTEFASSEAIIRDIPRVLKKIEILDIERPISIQIFGGVESSMGQAAQVVEQFQPDFIDINCGCWVKNHVNRGEGAGLLKDIGQFERVVKATVNATNLPVTVKTRLGWDHDNINIIEVAKMLEQVGVVALTVHCRTRSQAHNGEADWSWLEKIKKAVTIPIIGNGDVTNAYDVKRMLETGCDGVMIARAAIGNPWIFKQAKHYIQTGQMLEPVSLREKIDVCIQHLKLSVQYKGLRGGTIPFRKYYSGYLKGLPNIAKLRADLMRLVELDEIIARLNQFADENLSEAIC